MGTHRIPVEAYVWTTSGPCCAQDLGATAELAIINPGGRVAAAAITSVSVPAERTVVRLRTTVGEHNLEAGTAITTRGARIFASAAADQILAGREVRIEVAQPRDLPWVEGAPDICGATRGALALLELGVVRVPRRLGMRDELADMLDAALIRYVDASDDRWTALCFDGATLTAPSGPVRPEDVVALQAITAWARTSGGTTISRTTLDERPLRQRLVAALGAVWTPAQVTWSPAYGPVEARITSGPGSPFAKTRGVSHTLMSCIDVTVAEPGSAIIDLAIVRAKRT